MMPAKPQTLVEALATLPRGRERGFTFLGLDRKERFYAWEDLEREARRRAALLTGLGLQKGDRLAVVVAEPHEFVLSFLASVVAGIVPVPIYPRASFKARNAYVETVRHIVRASGARGLVTLDNTRPVIEEVLDDGTELEHLIILDDFLQGEPTPAQLDELPEPEMDEICFLQFTSGSTSMPKGVVVTHANLKANADAFLGPKGLMRAVDDIALAWLPLYHDMGLIGFVLATILHDLKTVLIPTESFARRPGMWMQAMHDYKATITFAPNFAYGLAAKRTRDKDLETMDLSAVRIAGCGAEPINPEVMRTFADRFAPAGFRAEALMPAYGMAEATLAISFHPRMTPLVTDRVDSAALQAGRAEPAEPGQDSVELISCGYAFPEHEVRIVDADGNTLAERLVGEIATRGPSVTSRYYENEQASGEAFRNGWLHTGDQGYMAGDRVYVCGRIKDLIIIRGANHYPQDIEWAVSTVEGVRRDNVIAFSVMRDGEETLIVAAEGNSSDAAELRKTIAARVMETNSLAVGHVAVVKVGSLPKTSSGKVQRRRTKQLFESGELEEHPA